MQNETWYWQGGAWTTALFRKHRRKKQANLITDSLFLCGGESLAGSDSQAFNWIGKMFAEQVVMAAATLQRDNVLL